MHEGNGVNDFDSGTSSSDNITNLETVKFRVTGLSTDDNSVILVDTGNDNDASNDSDVVEATIDGAVVDLTVTSLATTTYAAKVTDAAGNESILSETISVTFDNTPTDIDGYDEFSKSRFSEKTMEQTSAIFGWGDEDVKSLKNVLIT